MRRLPCSSGPDSISRVRNTGRGERMRHRWWLLSGSALGAVRAGAHPRWVVAAALLGLALVGVSVSRWRGGASDAPAQPDASPTALVQVAVEEPSGPPLVEVVPSMAACVPPTAVSSPAPGPRVHF